MQFLILKTEITAEVKGEAQLFSRASGDAPLWFSSPPTSLLLRGAKIHSKVNVMSLFHHVFQRQALIECFTFAVMLLIIYFSLQNKREKNSRAVKALQ